MPDDLTALLQGEMCTAPRDTRWQRLGREELPCQECEGCDQAARLAEVVRDWYAAKDVARGRETERRIDASRQSESEAASLLWELRSAVGVQGQAYDGRLNVIGWVRPETWEKISAYLTSRKEPPRA